LRIVSNANARAFARTPTVRPSSMDTATESGSDVGHHVESVLVRARRRTREEGQSCQGRGCVGWVQRGGDRGAGIGNGEVRGRRDDLVELGWKACRIFGLVKLRNLVLYDTIPRGASPPADLSVIPTTSTSTSHSILFQQKSPLKILPCIAVSGNHPRQSPTRIAHRSIQCTSQVTTLCMIF